MKNGLKKGFTIVELVIVVAVIAVIAAVVIPTFTSVIGKAKESAAFQQAKSCSETVMYITTGNVPENTAFLVSGKNSGDSSDYTYVYSDNALRSDENDVYRKCVRNDLVNASGNGGQIGYVVYVSASVLQFNEETGQINAGRIDNDAAERILSALFKEKISVSEEQLSYTVSADGSCAVWSANYKTFNVYWSEDIRSAIIVFMGGDENILESASGSSGKSDGSGESEESEETPVIEYIPLTIISNVDGDIKVTIKYDADSGEQVYSFTLNAGKKEEVVQIKKGSKLTVSFQTDVDNVGMWSAVFVNSGNESPTTSPRTTEAITDADKANITFFN